MWFKFPRGMCPSNQRQSECCPQLRTKWLLETQYMGALSCQRLIHSFLLLLSLPAPNLKNEMIGGFLSAFKTTHPKCNWWKLTIGLETRRREKEEAGSTGWEEGVLTRWGTSWLVSVTQEENNRGALHYCPHSTVCRLVRKERSKKCHQKDFQKKEKRGGGNTISRD